MVAILLRGINVGAHNRIKMSDLVRLLSEAGFEDVRTYIQSGNVRLESGLPLVEVVEAAESALTSFGIRNAAAVALEWARLEELVRSDPFGDTNDGSRGLGIFLRDPLDEAPKFMGDRNGLTIVHAERDVLFGQVAPSTLHMADFKKLIERPLGTLVTVRFWNVMEEWLSRQ
jgi:uncharacterized protein (DUF1697 family)